MHVWVQFQAGVETRYLHHTEKTRVATGKWVSVMLMCTWHCVPHSYC